MRWNILLLLGCVALVLVAVVLWGVGRDGEKVAVTREAPPATGEAVAPVATEAAPLGGPRLVVGAAVGRPLHGEPPYSARLTADFYDSPAGLPAPCTMLVWRFGDGQEERVPCVIDDAAAPHDWTIDHDYANEGVYHASARMLLLNGTIIESEKVQTVLVAEAQRPTLAEMAVRWLAWLVVLLGIGLALMWIVRQKGRRRLWGAAALALALITFVPPFSYAPDPLGIVLAVTGGYSHDPRLPFANRFLMASDGKEALQPTLDTLIGETGLDPLDPVSPLARYEFVKVSREPYHTAVHVRFTYENGEQRTYPVPLRHPQDPQYVLGFYPCCWRFDGLGRLRTAHVALEPADFPEGDEAWSGAPQRLDLPAVDAENAQNWFAAAPGQRMMWSADSEWFLAPATDGTRTALWALNAQEGTARTVAENVWEYAWTPDGAGILYSTVTTVQGAPQRQVFRVDLEGGEPRQLLALPVGESGFPGVTAEGLWYARDGAIWLLPWGANEEGARRVGTMLARNAGSRGRQPVQVRPAPDGERVAYTCGDALCMMDGDGGNGEFVANDERFVSLAWRQDGQQLAAVFWDYAGGDRRPALLRVIERDGSVSAEIAVAPDGPVDTPQWEPDGRVWLQTYPQDGRRIIVVEPESGKVTDLSQPRWDAFFALHPDGERVLLSNGRGGFWVVDGRGWR